MLYIPLTCRILKQQCRMISPVVKVYSSHRVENPSCVNRTKSKILTKPHTSSGVRSEAPLLTVSSKVSLLPIVLIDEPARVTAASKTGTQWKEMKVDASQLPHHFLMLSKFRLTSLVVITSMAGYAMSSAPFDPATFFACAIGTGLVSSAANSINQFLEVPFDAQMSRTKNRVLVKGALTPLHAIGFAVAASTGGLLMLYHGTNGMTAALGAANLILYTSIYTPLKRISILNTWVGSVVGAIPPLMGWAACEGSLGPGAWIMGGLLYAWQFPHFNALSWNLRPDYSRAGYRMMAVTDPGLCRRVALRYTFIIAGLSTLAPLLDVTHWSFPLLSLPLNSYFIYLGYKFYKESDSASSRNLFKFSLLHLPLLMGLLLLTKKNWNFVTSDDAVGYVTEVPEGDERVVQSRGDEARPSARPAGDGFISKGCVPLSMPVPAIPVVASVSR